MYTVLKALWWGLRGLKGRHEWRGESWSKEWKADLERQAMRQGWEGPAWRGHAHTCHACARDWTCSKPGCRPERNDECDLCFQAAMHEHIERLIQGV